MFASKNRRVKAYCLVGMVFPKILSSTSVVWAALFFFSKSLVGLAENLRFLDLISGSYQRGAKSSSVKVLSCRWETNV